MNLNTLLAAAWATGVLATHSHALGAEDTLAAATKRILKDNKDAVVWVSAAVTMNVVASESKSPVSLPDQERKVEALVTLIDSNGLAVGALSTIDPSRELTGRELRTGSGLVKIDVSATLRDVKLILPEGTEVPADVVMKDLDLDLVFLKPKAGSKGAKAAAFRPIDLKRNAEGAAGDDVVTVVRMDEMFNRQPGVQGGQISAITQKPRAFLRVNGGFFGCPTFAMDGRLLGLSVGRWATDRKTISVLLPAKDVAAAAEQAKAAKPLSGDRPKAGPSETKATNVTRKATQPK